MGIEESGLFRAGQCWGIVLPGMRPLSETFSFGFRLRTCALDPDCGLQLRNGADNHLKGWLDQWGRGGGDAFPFFAAVD